MNEWIIPIILVIVWVTLTGSTWLYIRHTDARAKRGYMQGWEDGWKQHVAAQLATDKDYARAYTEGWLACLDTLDTWRPGWQDRESEYRRWLNDPKSPDFGRRMR